VFVLAEGVKLVAIDDDIVAFNPFSWETHILNPAAAIALELASAGQLSAASLQEELEQALEADERSAAASHAVQLIRELDGLRLLRPASVAADAR
jgi:PqqD family protein of HPr-rel-A system